MLIYGREGPWAIPLVLVEKGHWGLGARNGGAALYPLSPTPRTTHQSLTTREHHDYQRDAGFGTFPLLAMQCASGSALAAQNGKEQQLHTRTWAAVHAAETST